jgi:rhamnose utilization protein RhaD (predicted bifunctional aldolase and dehydrogenase)
MVARGASAELTALLDLSARLGRQQQLVQASTGNTSLKVGDTLWIKASGKWLAHASEEEIFLPVNCAEPGRYLCADTFGAKIPGATPELKPSIETPMHVVLPHRVVIHVHSVSAIAWSVQRNGPSFLRERLAGFRWSWIRYTPSGVPLARAIGASLRHSPDVFLLANHGIVIGGDSCEEAEAKLKEVEERLAIQPRQCSDPDLLGLQQQAAFSDFRLPEANIVHSLATDEWSAQLISNGVLYPCQAMFLGRRPCVVSTGQTISLLAKQYLDQNGFRPPVLLFPNRGVLVAKDLTCSESEILIGLSQVVGRLAPGVRIAYLSERRVESLLNSNAYAGAQPTASRSPRAANGRIEAAAGSRLTA